MILQRLPSFRNRLRLLLVAFVAALVVALSFVVDIVAEKIIRHSGEQQLAQAASRMVNHLDEDMADPFRDVKLSATAHEVRAVVAGGDPIAAQAWIERIKAQLPLYAWIGITDQAGRVLAASGGILAGADVSKRPWFVEGQAGPVVIDVHEALLLQKHLAPNQVEPLRFVDVAAPVLRPDGTFGGVIAAHLSWGWAEVLQRSTLRTIANLDRAEILVLSASKEVLLGPRHLIGRSFRDLRDEAYVSMEAQSQGIGDHPGLGWSVVARQPVEAALAPVWRFRVTAVGGVILISLVFSFVAERIARTAARPFEALTRDVEALQAEPDRVAPWSHRPTFDEDGKLARSLARAFETLQERDADQRRLNATLEAKVDERTQALKRAKELAEAATEAKTEFLATMSHEIRSPLGSIVGLTDLLLEDPAIEERHRRRLALIQSASAGLTSLVNDILDLSKLETSAFQITERPFRLDRLVETCTDMLKAQAEPKGVALTLEFDPSLPATIAGDEHRIRQVLINLLGNAVKFTRSGFVKLAVRASNPSDRIHFSVIDSGIGISSAKIGALFQRYAQADTSIQHEFGGTGLGLAISQRLVNLMGGEITVTSQEGCGSTFAFSLPLRAAAMPDNVAAEPVPHAARPLQILIVDDLSTNREVATAILERFGHSVDAAGDGLEALRTAESRLYDVILLDIQMPGLDGVSVAQRIRAGDGPNALTPIVAMTANVLPRQIARFREAGMDAHVAKPIVRRELVAAIEGLLATEPAAPAAPLPDSFSPTAYDDVRSLLGPEKTEEYLADLVARIERPWQGAEPRERLAETAHKIVGLAGMLGFTRLAERCRMLEAACDSEGDVSAVLAEVNAASTSALVQVARLMAECRTASGDAPLAEARGVAVA